MGNNNRRRGSKRKSRKGGDPLMAISTGVWNLVAGLDLCLDENDLWIEPLFDFIYYMMFKNGIWIEYVFCLFI
jgi:hypothetical protein